MTMIAPPQRQLMPGNAPGVSMFLEAMKELGFKHDAPGDPSPIGYLHGPDGLLTFPGMDPQVWTTVVGLRPGLIGSIPTRASQFMSPIYEVITGVGSESGEEKDGVCDLAPIAGLMKAAKITAPFGRYEFRTTQIDLTRVGQLNDRADPMDIRLQGSGPLSPNIFGVDQSAPPNVLVNEMEARMWERNIGANRKLAQQTWIGNPANNTAGGGYREFNGVDLLVKTGYVDAETGVAIPAIDSDVRSFNFQSVETAGADLVDTITNMWRNQSYNAQLMGLDPVRFVFAMRQTLFYEVTKVWPCAYYLGGCTVADASGQRVTIDARDQIDLRDQMRQGRFLLIDGAQVEVVVDDAIPELNGNDSGGYFPAGCFASNIYLLPMSALGGTSTLYLEYFNFDNNQIADIIRSQMGGIVLASTRTNGAWIDTVLQTIWCLQWQMAIMPRLILRTPWLASKLEDVVYCPIQQPRSAFPDDPYYVNGGQEYRPGPSYYPGPWIG